MDQGMHSSRRSRTAGTVRRTTGSDFTASVAPSLAGWTATTGRHSGSSRQRINIYTVVSGRWARAGRQAAPGRGHQAVITRTQRLLLPSRSTPLLQLQRARSSIADSTRRQQARPQVSARFNSVHRSPCAMVGMDHPTFRNGGGGAPHLRPLVSRICICVSPEPRSMTPCGCGCGCGRVRTKGGKKRANTAAAKDEPKAPPLLPFLCRPCLHCCCGMRTTPTVVVQKKRHSGSGHAAPSPAGVAYLDPCAHVSIQTCMHVCSRAGCCLGIVTHARHRDTYCTIQPA